MKTRPKSPLSTRAWIAWIVGVTYVILVFGFQTGYAITNSKVAESIGLSAAQIGLVGSTYTWSFAAAQLLSGSLLDRVGAPRLLPVAATLLSAGIFSFAVSQSFVALLLSQVLVALGAAFGFVGAGFIGGAWFGPSRFGIMFAWVQFVASFSAFLSQSIFSLALSVFAWDTVIKMMAASGALIVVVMLAVLRDPPGWEETHGWPKEPVKFAGNVLQDVTRVVKIPGMWSTLLVGAISFGAMISLGTVWGPELGLDRGFPEREAQFGTSLAWLGLAFGAPTFVAWSDRIQRRRTPLLLCVVVQAVAILLLLWAGITSVAGYYVLMFILGFGAGGSMLAFTMGAELAGPGKSGTSAALVNGAQFAIGGVMMSLPGSLISAIGNVQLSLTLIPVLLLAMLIAGIWLPETGKAREATSPTRQTSPAGLDVKHAPSIRVS
jgi:MFS family permease